MTGTDPAATIASLQARIANLEAELAKKADELAEARRDADHDPLTGLLNRAGFVKAWAARPEPAGERLLALVDVDNFKAVNDRYGHAVGDMVLVAVARSLGGLPMPMAARLGGDEFVALVNSVGWLPARVGATLPGGATVSVELSIGLTPAVGDLSTALARADAAMYRAKNAGTHTEVYGAYRDDRPIEERPRLRLRDDSPVVAEDVLRSIA